MNKRPRIVIYFPIFNHLNLFSFRYETYLNLVVMLINTKSKSIRNLEPNKPVAPNFEISPRKHARKKGKKRIYFRQLFTH